MGNFSWQPQPQAAAFVEGLFAEFCAQCPDAQRFARRLLEETGTRLIDWTDHLGLPPKADLGPRLEEAGFVPLQRGSRAVWEHPGGLFPQIIVDDQAVWRLALRVESVADFLIAQGSSDTPIEGPALGQLRKARIAKQAGAEVWVVERHGYADWGVPELQGVIVDNVLCYREAFLRRKRRFATTEEGFAHAMDLVRAAVADLGTGWASDLFFAAERDYWTRRNRAAQFQKARQDALGLGWGNHDHHTYRSSREHFAGLIRIFEELGLACRERFYAGREAGWGAQVLEQEASGVVVFADVDLGPAEVVEDFAHQSLPSRAEFGTVGLWCLLHGEALLQPGMHHLECRFDFDAARQQIQRWGIRVLKPFTDLPYLKQAFTEGESWPVGVEQLEAALAVHAITPAQADQFRHSGVLGSHLEILQRDEGYKGFNQAGINEIIRDTDPRRQHGAVLVGGA
jgi:hypothetical protein